MAKPDAETEYEIRMDGTILRTYRLQCRFVAHGIIRISAPLTMWSISTAFLLLSYGFVQALPHASNNSATSKGDLNWAPCDLDFPQSLQDAITVPIDCATLKVPLDYTNPKDGRTLDLQLVKVNATQGPRKGSVIFNPGGPGSSGVEEVAQQGPLYVETLGGQYDIIGFDAR